MTNELRRSPAANWAAIGQGGRTAIVAFGGFAIGYWGYDRLQIAVFATFGGLALTGIANFGGTRRGRFAANAVAGLAGVGLASLGTWASSQPMGAALAVTFVVGGAAVSAGLFGGYWAVASNAVILYYLVAVGSPTPTAAIPDRVYGVVIGGVLAAVASVALWPEEAGPELLALVGARVRGSGEALLSLGSAVGSSVGSSVGWQTPGDGAPGGVRASVDRSIYRPAGPTNTERAALYLLNDLERLEHLVRRIAQTRPDANERAVLTRAGHRLQHVATTLTGESPQTLTNNDSDDESCVPFAAIGPGLRFGLTYRVQVVTEAIVAHAAAAGGAPPDPDGAMSRRYVSPVVHGARRVRAHLSLRSVHLQDSVRTATALAVAYLLARELALQHGFWVELATLTVIRSGAAATTRSVGQAVVGTSIGVAIAFAVINGAGTNIAAYAVITPVAIAVAIYLRAAFNFLAGQAGFTVSVLVLFSLLRPAGWHIGIVRLEDVLVGTAAGLAASVLAWPRGSLAAIGPAAADLIDKSSDYLQGAAQRIVAGPSGPASPDRPGADRLAALSAMLRAESAYSQLIAERSDQTTAVRWSPIMAAGNRLWYVADLISTAGEGPPPDREQVSRSIQRLAKATREASADLRKRLPRTNPVVSAAPAATPTGDALAAWIDDLANQFESLWPAVAPAELGDSSLTWSTKDRSLME